MSIVLWITLIAYIVVAVLFNLAFLYVYNEDKTGWTESDGANNVGMFLCSILWPIPLIYGIFKMKKEESN